MKLLTFVLFVLFLGYAQSLKCCTGTYDINSLTDTNVDHDVDCPAGQNTRCFRNVPSGTSQATVGCGGDETSNATDTCTKDNCNCPSGNDPSVMDSVFGDMKKIMYPVMGMIFGVLWIILAFIGARLPLTIILIVVGLIDAIFGIFLIFVPITTFLGLFYIAVGAFTIAVSRHKWGGDHGIDFLLALTLIVFLLTGGLTFIAFDFGRGYNYIDRMASYIPSCDQDMNISPDSGELANRRSTRCGNYAYFVTFSVYLLFLIQPIAMIAAAFKRVGHHTDTTVVVNEKHSHEMK
jgi:hypothetical protein